jgi:hypothetical protein
MQRVRRERLRAWCLRVLAGWLTVLGVAVVTPWLSAPSPWLLVCSARGLSAPATPEDGEFTPLHHTLACPLCAVAGAPPPHAASASQFADAPLFTPSALTDLAPTVRRSAAPLPARGPPLVA